MSEMKRRFHDEICAGGEEHPLIKERIMRRCTCLASRDFCTPRDCAMNTDSLHRTIVDIARTQADRLREKVLGDEDIISDYLRQKGE